MRTVHAVDVRAGQRDVFDAVRFGEFAEAPVVRRLFRLRGIPRWAVSVDGLLKLGFRLLAERSGEEFVVGVVARPWRLLGGLAPVGPAAFHAFAEPGYAKIVWNFSVGAESRGVVRLSTETRVRCTDARSRRKFAAYWAVVGPFSGWTRREMLRSVKSRLEQAVNLKETI